MIPRSTISGRDLRAPAPVEYDLAVKGWLCEWVRKLPGGLNQHRLTSLSLSEKEEGRLRAIAFGNFVRALARCRVQHRDKRRNPLRAPRPATVAETRVSLALERSRSMLECLLEALQWVGFPVTLTVRETTTWLCRMAMWDLADLSVAWMKFNLAYAFAKRRDQEELPPTPDWFAGKPGILGGGQLYCASRWLMRDCSWSASATFSQGVKRGMPEVSDDLCEAALLKHNKVLTSAPLEGECPLGVLEAQVRRTVREIRPEQDRAFDLFCPSTSGHYEASRAEGGAAGPVLDWIRRSSEKAALAEEWPLIIKNESGRPVLSGCPEGLELYESAEQMLYSAIGQPLPATPVPIVEPLKVRMITKGPAIPYYLCRKLQTEMWSTLRKRPYSELCGRPVYERGDPSGSLGFLGPLIPGNFWVSGDYESATDLLHRDLSVAALLEWGACAGWDPALIDLGCRALVSHSLDYGKLGIFDQQNGQLMGSPVSFPVLCIVNLALTRYALELRRGERIKLIDSGILVNGDDVLFQTDEEGYRIWKSVTASGGLRFSLGKNYVSRTWCMINSTLFLYSEVPDYFGCLVPQFYPVPWLNLGLLRGMQKGVGNITTCVDRYSFINSLGSRARDLCSNWPWERHSDLVSAFIRHHSPLLALVQDGISWFLPRTLGGVGLPTWDLEATLTNGQRKYATFFATSAPRKAARLMSLYNKDGGSPLLVEALRLYEKVEPLLPEKEADDLPWGGLCTLAWLRGCPVKQKFLEPTGPRTVMDNVRRRVRRQFQRIWSESQRCTLTAMSGWKLRDFPAPRKLYRELHVSCPLLFGAGGPRHTPCD